MNFFEIDLGDDIKAKVDLDDFDKVSKYKWYGSKQKRGGIYVKNIYKRKSLYLHRLIMDAKKGQIVDHINGDTLDNRKCNLRLVNGTINSFNSRMNKTTLPRGVYKYKNRAKPYFSQIQKDGNRYCLGYYQTVKEAHDAYIKKAMELYGEEIVKNIR